MTTAAPQLTAIQAIEKVTKDAPTLPDIRVIKSIKPGQMIRQGDIYAICVTGMKEYKAFGRIDVKLADYLTAIKKEVVQLVPGVTNGSRHMVHNVDVFINPTNRESLIGPLIRSSHNFKISHPEHAHFELPAGDYLITYQLNDKTRERVRD